MQKESFEEGSRIFELYRKLFSEVRRVEYFKHLAIAYEYVKALTKDNVVYKSIKEVSSYKADYLACQMAHGDTDIMLGISGNKEALLYLAGCYAREKFAEINEDSYDSLCEVTNMIDGMFAAILEDDGVELELVPPMCCENCNITANGNFYVMSLEVNGKQMDIISIADVIPYLV